MIDPTLKALIEEWLPGLRWGLFFTTVEGSFFPNGDEDCSGCVVVEDGRHIDFWTDWDDERQTVRFGLWREIDASVLAGCWAGDREYREARAAAGLPVTPPS